MLCEVVGAGRGGASQTMQGGLRVRHAVTERAFNRVHERVALLANNKIALTESV